MSAAGWAEEVTRRWLQLAEEVQRRLGTGVPLPPAARDRYARRLGFDAGVAALHRGPFAAGLAGALGAAAFTAGRHIAGGEAALDPQTALGEALLGHELTHVGQATTPPLPALPLRPPVLARRARETGWTAPAPIVPAPIVQRATGGEGDGEAAALATEAALLRSASRRGASRSNSPPDAERLAELVYRRLVDALREEASRTAGVR